MLPPGGRAHERVEIARLIQKTLSGGAAGILLVGEAGIGKSYLFDQVTHDAAAQGWICLVAESD